MTDEQKANREYLMGHTPEETARLQTQSDLYNRSTRRLFEDAGIRAGMKVLDVGTGAGDVALIVAEMVGPSGHVIGIDNNPSILDTARQRAHNAGATHVAFVDGEIDALDLADDFDAIVGRLVLIHLADPAAMLRTLTTHVRPAGIVAFQDIDWTAGPIAWPPSVLLAQVWQWAPEMFRRASLNPHTGLSLHEIFLAAGLSAPSMSFDAPVGGGPAFLGYDYIAEGLRSSLPHIVRLGIATHDEVNIETFSERLRAETVGQNGVIVLPTFVGAWTHKGPQPNPSTH